MKGYEWKKRVGWNKKKSLLADYSEHSLEHNCEKEVLFSSAV